MTAPTMMPRPRGYGYVTPIWQRDRWRFRSRFPDGSGGERTLGTYATEPEAHLALNAQARARADADEPSPSACHLCGTETQIADAAELAREIHTVELLRPTSGVYAIGAVELGLIKIGKAQSIEGRFRYLQRASPARLELLGVLSLDQHDEGMFHDQWRRLCVRGEWFRVNIALRQWIAEKQLEHRRVVTRTRRVTV